MKAFKRITKHLFYKTPEIVAGCGIIALLLVASADEYSILVGEGSPDGTLIKAFFCLLAVGIGSLLARFRSAIINSRAKRR